MSSPVTVLVDGSKFRVHAGTLAVERFVQRSRKPGGLVVPAHWKPLSRNAAPRLHERAVAAFREKERERASKRRLSGLPSIASVLAAAEAMSLARETSPPPVETPIEDKPLSQVIAEAKAVTGVRAVVAKVDALQEYRYRVVPGLREHDRAFRKAEAEANARFKTKKARQNALRAWGRQNPSPMTERVWKDVSESFARLWDEHDGPPDAMPAASPASGHDADRLQDCA